MNTKRLIIMFVASLITTSSVQAADIAMPQETNSRISPVIITPPFSWTGLYLGGQLGNFSSKDTLNYSQDATTGKWAWVDKDLLPKPSGFVGGLYGGSNVDLGTGFIMGVDTDMVWSHKKDTKTDDGKRIRNDDELDSIQAVFAEAGISIKKPGAQDETIPNYGDIVVSSVSLEEKWAGATRVRIGFTANRVMPYVAGGIAYAQMQYIMSLLSKSQEDGFVFASGDVVDKTETMIGYTVGGGLDFAITDHVIMRAEYRYSDFGKKKFVDDKLEISHKTNNFRIGVAYKF
ncbi:outer membrane protein [Bartonella florencae]|uniref:outer membrane protein n=1 Tax=Bartonella florencae TaxID=928210 RepID=UPI0003085E17|nr:outer membrane protein [Bartonella florencae]